MKNLTIASTLVTMSLGAFVSACGGAETSSQQASPGSDVAGSSMGDPHAALDFATQQDALTSCDDPQYDHWRYISALAVAAGNELGRWNLTDFTNSGGVVGLSSSGLARCKNGCQNVQAILQLQTQGGGVIPRHDPNLLKSYLTTYYNDQLNWNIAQGVSDHSLVPSSVTPASCGYRYWFRDTITKLAGTSTAKVGVSGKCLDITGSTDGAKLQQTPCDGRAGQSFVVDPVVSGGYRLKNNSTGKCARVVDSTNGSLLEMRPCDTSANQLFDINLTGSSVYAIKSRMSGMCAEIINWSTADYTQVRQAACNQYNTPQQFAMTLGTVNLDNPNQANMYNTLKFVGQNVNPYIQFQYTTTEVSIDPMGTLVDGGSSGQSGSCLEGSTVYDSTRTSAGKCCEYSGTYGKLVVSSWNPSMYYCK